MPLDVEPTFFTWRGHQIAHYTAGAGEPVLLVHSINAAASAYEVRAPFAALQDTYEVHAIDLLGFGLSDRPPRVYRATDYINLIADTLERIGKPVALVASSLSSAFAVAATARLPHLVRSLVLVAPTGLSQLAGNPSPLQFALYDVLRSPVGDVVFNLIRSPFSVRYYLEQQTYGNPKWVTNEVFQNFYLAAQFPGAKHAPISFVTGLLNYDIRADYARLSQPIMVVWGRKLKISPPRLAQEFVEVNANTRLELVDDSALPIEDQPELFNRLVRDFLA